MASPEKAVTESVPLEGLGQGEAEAEWGDDEDFGDFASAPVWNSSEAVSELARSSANDEQSAVPGLGKVKDDHITNEDTRGSRSILQPDLEQIKEIGADPLSSTHLYECEAKADHTDYQNGHHDSSDSDVEVSAAPDAAESTDEEVPNGGYSEYKDWDEASATDPEQQSGPSRVPVQGEALHPDGSAREGNAPKVTSCSPMHDSNAAHADDSEPLTFAFEGDDATNGMRDNMNEHHDVHAVEMDPTKQSMDGQAQLTNDFGDFASVSPRPIESVSTSLHDFSQGTGDLNTADAAVPESIEKEATVEIPAEESVIKFQDETPLLQGLNSVCHDSTPVVSASANDVEPAVDHTVDLESVEDEYEEFGDFEGITTTAIESLKESSFPSQQPVPYNAIDDFGGFEEASTHVPVPDTTLTAPVVQSAVPAMTPVDEVPQFANFEELESVEPALRTSITKPTTLPLDLVICEEYRMKLRDVLPLPRPPAPPPTIADAEEILGLFEAVTRVRRFARRPSDAANERWLDDVVRRWISSHTPEDVGAYFAEIQIQTQQEKHPTPRRASARDQGERFSAAHIEEKDSFSTVVDQQPFEMAPQNRSVADIYHASEYDLEFLETFGLPVVTRVNSQPSTDQRISTHASEDGLDMDFFLMSSSAQLKQSQPRTKAEEPLVADGDGRISTSTRPVPQRAREFVEALPDLSYLLPVSTA